MKKILFGLLATLAYNTAIAGLLTLLSPNFSFFHNYIFSNCIGFSIALINTLTITNMNPGLKRWVALCLTLPFSILIGLTFAFWLTGTGDWHHPYELNSVLIGLFFGIISIITFVLFERIENLDLEIKERQLNQIESEKREVEVQLKMLQAQIEPHFLFNTLANVSSLIGSDPVLAKILLERLNDWLRVALARARSENATLGDELDMLENYLQIMHIRFGERLHWDIAISEDLRLLSFPPMLLQPLVENAIRHGIEPKLGGGKIIIRADLTSGNLRIEVIDNGTGLIDSANTGGTGLVNVRARVAALFGEAGRLTLCNNAEGGVTASLELPQ